MAGDWIKMRKKLLRDGRVLEMSRVCHALRVTIVGALVALWSIADDYAESDGLLPGYTAEDIDRETELPGFTQALPSDWCELRGPLVYLPNYQEHNGDTAKQRAQATDRQSRRRERENLSRTKRDKSVTREEKRREELGEVSPKTPLVVEADDSTLGLTAAEFIDVWNAVTDFARCKCLTGKRLKAFQARSRDRDWVNSWRVALKTASRTPFCCGANDRGWRGTVDWFLRQDTVTKIMEGFYGDPGPTTEKPWESLTPEEQEQRRRERKERFEKS